ncbi:MAG: hypothetical protein E4G98_01100 [Promethearchaeota archaeon]|nr:MAG: hypothetical protein E4G98_01100 [Candidatus Lokiarchaeota archaeon]
MKANPEKLIDLIDDKTEFIILVCLHMFPSSLNLKKISDYTDIPESSALRKIKDLISLGHIVLDQSATMTNRGKYYKLSDRLIQIMDNEEDDSFNFKKSQLDDKKISAILSLADAFEALTSLNNSMTQLFARNFKTQIKDLEQIKKSSTLHLSMMELSLQNKTEIDEVNEIFIEFSTKLKKFHRKAHPDGPPNHNLFFSIYPIGEIELEEAEDQEEAEKENETNKKKD